MHLVRQGAGGVHPAAVGGLAFQQLFHQFVDFVVFVQGVAGGVEAAVVHQQRGVEVALLGRGVGGQFDAQLREDFLAVVAPGAGAQQAAAQGTLDFMAFAQGFVDGFTHRLAPGGWRPV